MKAVAYFSMLICISASGISANAVHYRGMFGSDDAMALATTFAREFLLHFNGIPAKPDLKFEGVEIKDISFPVLPPLPDPLHLNDSSLEIPNDGGSIHGYFNTTESSVAGLSDVVDMLTLSPTPDYEFLFKFLMTASELSIGGLHDANLTIVDLPAEIISLGNYSLHLTRVFLGLSLKVKILLENKLSITSVSLDPAFKTLKINTTLTTIEGSPMDWDAFNESISENFPALWESVKETFDGVLAFALDMILKDCLVTDLVKGDLECILGESDPETRRTK